VCRRVGEPRTYSANRDGGLPARFGVLVMWNNTVAETLTATDGDHEFIATPVHMQAQQA
jgi:hypothetical protein